jgi:hypothetical protein
MAALADHHREALARSGIDPERAAARGYETISDKQRLAEIKITPAGRRVPGLLVPLLDVRGSVWGYQLRPDIPRIMQTGRLVKYESPSDQRNGIDVPPGVGPMLADPSIPLWVTEGSKKADCAAARGLCCVALLGVWSWRGTNTAGGKVALPDWQDVALNGRRVILAYDGDVARKESVRTAMDALAKYLGVKGARIEYLHLPDDDAGKVGLDDFLMTDGNDVDALWKLVKPIAPPPRQHTREDRQATPPQPPLDGNIDGAAVLDEVHDTLTRYVAFADKHQPVAVTLWTAANHGLRAWQHATRLVITSPSKRCGKSRLMDIVAGLSFSALLCGDISPAAVYRSIGDDDTRTPTLFLDEADVLFGTKRAAEQNEDLRGLFNNGWQRERPTIRCVGPSQIPTPFNTFAMAALASKGSVLPDTITDRAVTIALRRRGVNEKVARFRIRRDRQRLTELQARLCGWVRAHTDELADAEFDMPGVEDRALDAWEPLLAIAQAAGRDWPRKAKAACRVLADAAVDSDGDPGVQLLGDIRAVFTDAGETFLASNMLVRELRAIEESPWGDEPLMTASKLAKLLKPYRVIPRRNAAGTLRGYERDNFDDAFTRYLPVKPSDRQKDGSDQQEQPENGENAKCQEPSEAVRPSENSDIPDGLTLPARQLTVADANGESPLTSGFDPVSDGLTVAAAGTGAKVDTPLCECGNELVESESIRRGNCTRCFLLSKR